MRGRGATRAFPRAGGAIDRAHALISARATTRRRHSSHQDPARRLACSLVPSRQSTAWITRVIPFGWAGTVSWSLSKPRQNPRSFSRRIALAGTYSRRSLLYVGYGIVSPGPARRALSKNAIAKPDTLRLTAATGRAITKHRSAGGASLSPSTRQGRRRAHGRIRAIATSAPYVSVARSPAGWSDPRDGHLAVAAPRSPMEGGWRTPPGQSPPCETDRLPCNVRPSAAGHVVVSGDPRFIQASARQGFHMTLTPDQTIATDAAAAYKLENYPLSRTTTPLSGSQ